MTTLNVFLNRFLEIMNHCYEQPPGPFQIMDNITIEEFTRIEQWALLLELKKQAEEYLETDKQILIDQLTQRVNEQQKLIIFLTASSQLSEMAKF